MVYRIVTFDGGGVRGVYTAALLERLAVELPDLIDSADLLAGTSSGGIIALLLASGRSPMELVSLCRISVAKIVKSSWLHRLTDLGGLSGAQYDNTNFASTLREIFGCTSLSQLQKRVLVPSFRLDNQASHAGRRMWEPKFFHNFPGPDSDGTELVIDVAMRTSAAPVYFPTYQDFIDGGVVANDPSVAALAQAIDKNTGGQTLEDLRLFSVGTGANPTHITGHDLDWGLAQWARPLASLMIDGVMGVAEYQCRRLLASHYFRLEPPLPNRVAVDDFSAIDGLIGSANSVDLSETIGWLRSTFTPD